MQLLEGHKDEAAETQRAIEDELNFLFSGSQRRKKKQVDASEQAKNDKIKYLGAVEKKLTKEEEEER